jgi:hypothetical protein
LFPSDGTAAESAAVVLTSPEPTAQHESEPVPQAPQAGLALAGEAAPQDEPTAQDEPTGQVAPLPPFVMSEWAATAPASNITTRNTTVFHVLPPPGEQQSSPAGVEEQLGCEESELSCVTSSKSLFSVIVPYPFKTCLF